MSFKPGDFFLGVVSFLGDLVPGVVLLSLLLVRFRPQDWCYRANWSRVDWAMFAIAAYIAGHLLLAVSEMLNEKVDWFCKWFMPNAYKRLTEVEKKFRKMHRQFMCPECTDEKDDDPLQNRSFVFHTALSYVRLKSAEAAAEVDHHMADYKLLRCLLVMLPVIVWVSPHHRWLQVTEVLLGVPAVFAFVRMYNWARFLAFDYALQLSKLSVASHKK